MKLRSLGLFGVVLGHLGPFITLAFGQGTVITYQGRLNDGTNPANGSYDLRFALYDFSSGGTQQGGSITNLGAAVQNGLFTLFLDFGNQFPGAGRWLDIGVRTNGGAAFTPLAPRQLLTPAPYAVYAGAAASAGSVAATNIAGTIPLAQLPAAVLTNGASGVNLAGGFSGNGAGLTNVTALGAIAAFTNGLAYWIDAVYGNDSNSGLRIDQAVKTIAGLQARPYYGHNLNFIGPGIYTCPSTSSLVLSNNNVSGFGPGVVITDAPDDSSTNSVQRGRATIYVAGGPQCVIQDVEVRAACTTQLAWVIHVAGDGYTTNIVIRNCRLLGFTDIFDWSPSQTWTNPSSIVIRNNDFHTYWDTSINSPPSNSVVTVQGNTFIADSSQPAPGVSGIAANITSATWWLGNPPAVGAGLEYNFVGNTFTLFSTNGNAPAQTPVLQLSGGGLASHIVGNKFKVVTSISNAISIIQLTDGRHYLSGNSFEYPADLGITVLGCNNDSATAALGLQVTVAGHPFNDNEVTYAKGKSAAAPRWINFVGDVGTNTPAANAIMGTDANSNRIWTTGFSAENSSAASFKAVSQTGGVSTNYAIPGGATLCITNGVIGGVH